MTLKIYGWEHDQFREAYGKNIPAERRQLFVEEYAKEFDAVAPHVALTTRGKGRYSRNGWGQYIALPSPGVQCPLGLILHELAHALHWQREGKSGHVNGFKRWLIKCMVEGMSRFAAVERRVEEKLALEWESALKMQQRAEAASLADSRWKAKTSTPEYRIAALEKRIKRNETRIKRLNTLNKKARRSIAAIKRMSDASN